MPYIPESLGLVLPVSILYFITQATLELSNITIQERLESGWWENAMNKIEEAVPYDPYKVPILNVR